MSQMVDFIFNNLSRIGQDPYNHTQDAAMNNGQSSYMLTNLNSKNDANSLNMMTIYPTMNLKSSNQLGPAGYNVDDSTNLMKSKLTNTNCKISLQERSYLTVPYLGKGNIDVGLENSLKFGDTLKESKSSAQLGEKTQQDLEKYPLNTDIRKSLNNPSQRIEESAVKGWVLVDYHRAKYTKIKNYNVINKFYI